MLRVSAAVVLACLAVFTGGCSRLQHNRHDFVYVSARQMYLRDRVAAVSERVAQVTNGEPLEVLERNRRFYKVKTPKNEIGWIEEHAVIDSGTYDAFNKLAQEHRQDPAATTATLRDDLYMHVAPGRTSDHFYLLPGNAKVDLLERASVPRTSTQARPLAPRPVSSAPKPATPATPATAGKMAASAAKSAASGKTPPAAAAGPQPEPPPPPPMEDWWLARDTQGRVGWLLANRLDVDVPDQIAEYGEGQRFVGTWVLTKVTDPDSDSTDHQIPEYLAMTAPLSSGQPFDFDQVRVFTWSLKHHRYETAFRLHPVQGFLPVKIWSQSTPKGNVPVFSFQIAGSEAVTTDPATGVTRPAQPRTIAYTLIDTQVKRVGPDLGPIPTLQNKDADKKAKAAKAAKTKKKK